MVLGETLRPRAMSAAVAHMRPLDGSITAPSIVVAVSVSSSCVFIVPDFFCRFLGIGPEVWFTPPGCFVQMMSIVQVGSDIASQLSSFMSSHEMKH